MDILKFFDKIHAYEIMFIWLTLLLKYLYRIIHLSNKELDSNSELGSFIIWIYSFTCALIILLVWFFIYCVLYKFDFDWLIEFDTYQSIHFFLLFDKWCNSYKKDRNMLSWFPYSKFNNATKFVFVRLSFLWINQY